MAVWCCLAAQLCQLCQISHRFTSPPRPLLKIFAPVSEFFKHPLQLLPKISEPGYFVIWKIAVGLNHRILVMYKEWWEDARTPRSPSKEKLLTNNVDSVHHGSLRYMSIFWTVMRGKLLLSSKKRGLKKGFPLCYLYNVHEIFRTVSSKSTLKWAMIWDTQALWWLVTN